MKITFILMTSMAMTLQMCEKKAKAPEKSTEVRLVAQNETPKPPKVEKKKKPKAKKFAGKKMHPQKQYCIWYNHTGQFMSGTSQMCSRKYGQESFTISNTNIGMAGINQSQDTHSIILGKKIVNIDLAAKTYTIVDNPMYYAMSQSNAKKLGEQIMAALNMQDTGVDKTIANTKCNVLSSQFGAGCYTDSMIMLEQEVMGNKQTATKVDLNSGGPNSGYNRHKQGDVTKSDAPNIDDIMKKMGKGQ